jgi:NAD(P)-dependent dehydrogenase (short-subunit alcohol dehydrogenase family)
MNKIDLNGRCAVVTGGAQGFGRAITERFVASGAKVAIWDHDLPFAEKTAKEIGPAVSAFKVDVSDLAAVEKTCAETLKALGKELAQHDILVNAVTPAAAKTAIFDQMTQQHIDFMLSKIPKARFVLVEELAAMVSWLASEDCAFSTGAVFDISGGRATY